jgi:hypothetical protein
MFNKFKIAYCLKPLAFATSLGLGNINPAMLNKSEIICPFMLTSNGELECKLHK